MNYLLAVCLPAITLAATQAAMVAQSATPASTPEMQTLQPGISVAQPIAKHAVPIPDADRADALIVTITAEGRAYLGIDPVDPANLPARIQSRAAGKTRQELYIKPDSRASCAVLVKILDAARSAGIHEIGVLTAQPRLSVLPSHLAPEGFELVMPSGQGHLN